VTESANAPIVRGRARFADAAGVIGAIVAALCCAGTPLIVSALAAAGLSSLRRDPILWPVMLVSLAVALWGFWQGRRFHRNLGPLVIGTFGAASLACGVIVVHGPPAMIMIYGGAILLVVATLWNISARWRCARETLHRGSSQPAA
jgi:mercuric ion transport protein